MPGTEKFIKKNALNIRLTESAVFLRSDDATGRNQRHDSRPSVLRGLLTLELAKPTKITSIDLELFARTSTAWPEGIGARRVDVTEEHKVFSATTVLFRASGQAPRRATSIGPGATCYDELGLEEFDDDLRQQFNSRESPSTSLQRPNAPRGTRHMSVDYSGLQRHDPYSHTEEIRDLPPVPPYSPPVTTPSLTPGALTPSSTSSEHPSLSPTTSSRHLDYLATVHENPARTLEDFRNALRADLSAERRSPIRLVSPHVDPTSSSSSIRSYSLSRRQSIEDVPEDFVAGTVRSSPHTSPGPIHTSPADSLRSESRGRRRGRFSLTSMGSVLLDAVRLSPSRGRDEGRKERESTDEINSRGRRMERNNVEENPFVVDLDETPVDVANAVRRESRERTGFGRLGEVLGLDGGEEDRDSQWKEFRKGTYNYPIAFSIPGHAPPSLETHFGSVKWCIRATVHRPGKFKAKLQTQREVIVVTCPTEEDTEESENIIVERHWDGQLQYLIAISGRSFYVGGTIPVTFTMMPLAKIKIYRIMVYIEEKTEYYVQFKRLARTDPITRTTLLSIKEDIRVYRPVLPLDSDDPEAFKNSPLYTVVRPEDDVSEMASHLMGPGPWSFSQELKLPQSCKILRFTNKNRRSNMNVTHTLKCVIRIERGDDQAIDEKTGKRKLFDIVVQTPIQILSCRCNPEWISLPHYTECTEDSASTIPPCPCNTQSSRAPRASTGEVVLETRAQNKKRPNSLALERFNSQHSSDSGASAAESTAINPLTMRSLRNLDSLAGMNAQYEMLVSGMVTETGEVPPSYGSVVNA